MKQIFRLMIDDDPRIMDEDDMMEELYDKLDELVCSVNRLIKIIDDTNDFKKHEIRFQKAKKLGSQLI